MKSPFPLLVLVTGLVLPLCVSQPFAGASSPAADPFIGADAEGNIHINTTQSGRRVFVNGVDVLERIAELSARMTSLYMIGGAGGAPVVERFDGNSWTSLTAAPKRVFFFGIAATNHNGVIYASGGVSTSVSRAVESFDGISWTLAPSMSSPRCYHAMVSDGMNKLYAVGGAFQRSSEGFLPTDYTTTVEVFNGSAWTTHAPLLKAVFVVSAVFHDGMLLVAGNDNLCQRYNGSAWAEIAPYLDAPRFKVLLRAQGLLYAIGGPSNMTVQRYNGSSWELVGGSALNTTLSQPRTVFAAAVFRNSMYVVGGGDLASAGQSVVERFGDSGWEKAAPLNRVRYGGSAVEM